MNQKMVFSTKKVSISKIAIILILICTTWFQFSSKKWRWDAVIVWDAISYYAYLPATFIYNDLSLEFAEDDPETFSHRFWPSKSPTGRNVIKTSMGLAFLYSPFFAMAHLAASPLGYPSDGFSPPYQFFISIGALFYLLLGLIFLRKLLLRFFDEKTTAITLTMTVLGTNLGYYAAMEPAMSHTYGFAFYAIFLYLLDGWLAKPSTQRTILLGLTCGLLALMRPTNVLVGLFFIFWGVASLADIKQRLSLLLSRWKILFFMAFLAILVWVPQMVYWKIQTGQFFFNSYGDEGFFFLSPRILEGLFSFRKGLFVYTPLMFVTLAGFFVIGRYVRGGLAAIAVHASIHIYVIFSWWAWWYGGGYGSRAMIEVYAFIALPLAALIQWMWSRKTYAKTLFLSLLLLLLVHSIFQTFQYYYGAIHWDSMTRESYIKAFGRLRSFPGLEDYWRAPDYDLARKGIYANAPLVTKEPEAPRGRVNLFRGDMEELNHEGTFFITSNHEVLLEGGLQQTTRFARSGNHSVLVNNITPFALAYEVAVAPGEEFSIEVWEHTRNPKEAVLVVSAINPNDFYIASIRSVEKEDDWERIQVDVKIPQNIPGGTIKMYVWNPSRRDAHFDDLSVYRIIN